MDAIATNNLSKIYKGIGKRKIRSLDGLDLTVGENEVFGFLGRNGAGKTTAIKILCSLLKPSAGDAQVFGENVRSRAARRHIGYLPEQPYFYEYLNPRETLDFYGRLRGLGPAERGRQWDKLSELLFLREIAGERIKGFSKGMRQRVGFAVALVGDPPLLILDEPMSGLDPVGRRSIRELMLRLRDEKKTLFFSSHVLGDVEQICDRVGILVKGKLTKQGRINELIGARTTQVELVVSGLDRETAMQIKKDALQHHASDERDLFLLKDRQTANALLPAIVEAGGTLLELGHVKESLEDYFMREQTQDAQGENP